MTRNVLLCAFLGGSMSTASAEDSPRMTPSGSFLARGSSRMPASLGLLETQYDDAELGGSNPQDFADPDWAGFIQETQKGARTHKRYDDVVSKVAAEREIDIDIHSGFHDLEKADADEEQWLLQDSDLR